MVQVLITERFSLNTLVKMQLHPQLQVIHDLNWFQKPATAWEGIETLIIRSQTKVDAKLLKIFPKLKLVITATAGFNHIYLKLCQERGIRVAYCPTSHTASTAELTWGLILACARRLTTAQKAVRMGDWDRNKLMGTELSGKTLGVVGLGRVGSQVARIAKAFNMKLMAHDPYQEDEVFQSLSVERVSLEELLTQSDIITLHVPLTSETWHFIGEMYLGSLSPNTILINTCRGPVIHENALLQKLQAQKIGAVGMDVFEYEPLSKESRLLQFSNVVTTPHIGATTQQAFEKASQEAFDKTLEFISGASLRDELPPSASWFRLEDENNDRITKVDTAPKI